MIRNSAEIDLVNSLFDSNYDAAIPGTGVVNLGGQVQCDVEHQEDCLPVCTKCLDGRETPPPTPHPATRATLPPTFQPAGPPTNKQKPTALAGTISALLVLVFVTGSILIHRRVNASTPNSEELTTSTQSLTRSLLGANSVPNPPVPHVSFAVLQSSRAAIFVVGRTLRVEHWSTGNKKKDARTREC